MAQTAPAQDQGTSKPAGRSGSVKVVVVTPERIVFEATADFIAFPAFDGEIGILTGRSPLVARLGPGELRLTSKHEAKPRRYFVDGGFAQVRNDVVTILTPRCWPVDDINETAVQKQLNELNAEVKTTDEGQAAKDKQLLRARVQLHLAHKDSTHRH